MPTKAFNVDSYFDKVVSVEEDAVPPPNPTGSYAKLIIQAEGTLEFVMNSVSELRRSGRERPEAGGA